MTTNKNITPAVIVLCKVSTGLGTVRGLAAAGIDVHAVTFEHREPVHFSNCGKIIHLPGLDHDHATLLNWIINYAKTFNHRPVVFPTSDNLALMLAKHREMLQPYCRIWSNTYRDLTRLINKGELYQLAAAANIDIVPMIREPQLDQLAEWSNVNEGPYLLKPSYEGITSCALRQKNLVINSRDKLLAYVAEHGADSLIVQRLLQGGDGHIFDCYGLCNSEGKILTMASHRRWRQHPPNLGATSFGEIPANIPNGDDVLFENSARLLQAIRYHGIFGIEWLHEKSTDKFYIIDFNARPFSTIGHLTDCGLNLPALAYREIIGEKLPDLAMKPQLTHKYWVDILRDIETFSTLHAEHKMDFSTWTSSIFRCRSFAYWNWQDPLPGLYSGLKILLRMASYAWKKIYRANDPIKISHDLKY